MKQENDKFILELSGTEVRALRSLVHWAEMLEQGGELKIYEYQKNFMNRVKEIT